MTIRHNTRTVDSVAWVHAIPPRGVPGRLMTNSAVVPVPYVRMGMSVTWSGGLVYFFFKLLSRFKKRQLFVRHRDLFARLGIPARVTFVLFDHK